MSRVEQIVHQIHRLPEPLQEEVLDFIEFLLKKHHVKDNADDDESLFSMKGGLEHSTTFANGSEMEEKSINFAEYQIRGFRDVDGVDWQRELRDVW